jgi:RHS repeat-associated protein
MTGTGGTCTALNWTYDAWSNRETQIAPPGGGTCWQPQYTFLSNNQISGNGYDAAGNMISQTGATYTYDNENRLVATSSSGGNATYVYDASGRRVQKTVGSASTNYVYNKDGQVYAWLGAGGRELGYVFMNGQILAQYENGSTYFHHHDHLGSTRLVSEMNQGIQQCTGYYPFGEMDNNQCTPTVNDIFSDSLFTGKERDSESNLDNFEARYMASSLGRFMSPDAGAFQPLNPQSFNRYAYTLNNPLRLIDPDGMDTIDPQLLSHLTHFTAWAMPIAQQGLWILKSRSRWEVTSPSSLPANMRTLDNFTTSVARKEPRAGMNSVGVNWLPKKLLLNWH